VDKPEFPLPQSRQTFWSRPILVFFGFFVEFNLWRERRFAVFHDGGISFRENG
jgi:hypothetical protein